MNTKSFFVLCFGLFAFAGISPVAAQGRDQHWNTSCSGPSREASSLICKATENVFLAKEKQLLFKLELIYAKNQDLPVLLIQGPLGFYIPGQVKLLVDDKKLEDLSVRACDKRGCFIDHKLTRKQVAQLRAGKVMKIDFAPAPDKRQEISIPLTGISKALDALQ